MSRNESQFDGTCDFAVGAGKDADAFIHIVAAVGAVATIHIDGKLVVVARQVHLGQAQFGQCATTHAGQSQLVCVVGADVVGEDTEEGSSSAADMLVHPAGVGECPISVVFEVLGPREGSDGFAGRAEAHGGVIAVFVCTNALHPDAVSGVALNRQDGAVQRGAVKEAGPNAI